MRPRISIRGCVRPSVHRSVRDAFVKIAKNGMMQDGDASYVVYTALFNLNLMTVELVFVFKPHSNSLGIKEFHGDLPVWVDIKPIHYPRHIRC